MNYEDKKIVGIIATNVEAKIALNVIGHLAVAIGKYSDKEIMGQPNIIDKSGINHIGISRFPFIVTKVKEKKLKTAIEKAKKNSKLLVVDEQLEYLGAVIYGNTEDVNEITGKFQLWKIEE